MWMACSCQTNRMPGKGGFSLGIVAAGIAPHPPLIIPDIGREELSKVSDTVESLKQFSLQVASSNPDTVILITPHGPMHRHAPAIQAGEILEGDFAPFRAPHVHLSAQNDRVLIDAIEAEAQEKGPGVLRLEESTHSRDAVALDHGITVPLYYLQEAGTGQSIIAITFAPLPHADLFQFGKAIQKAVLQTGRKAAIVASGDLSHRLTRFAPAGYSPQGQVFDSQLVEHIRNYDVKALLNMDESVVSDAGECGLRSIIILLGCLDGLDVSSRVLSYEGPFGVGYLVASLTPQNKGKEAR